MNLIKVDGLVSTESSEKRPSDLEDQIRRVQEELDRTRGTIKHITERFAAMRVELERYNADVYLDISRLLAEIQTLRERIRKRVEDQASVKTFYCGGTHGYQHQEFNDDGYADAKDEVDTILSSEEEDPEIIRLFRRIAAKTHPDKSDNPSYHLLFIAAKEARAQRDMQRLQEIWDFLNGKAPDPASQAARELESLLEELAVLKANLDYIRRSHEYTMLNLFEQNRDDILAAVRAEMIEKRKRLRAHVEMLKSVLGEEDDQPKRYVQFLFGK